MVQTKRRLKKSVSDFIFKTLIVALITVILMITMKSNINFKTNFYKYVYDTTQKERQKTSPVFFEIK